jgi:D-alanyl-D-alanine endopeptidase (penicillin-binding protein 7)
MRTLLLTLLLSAFVVAPAVAAGPSTPAARGAPAKKPAKKKAVTKKKAKAGKKKRRKAVAEKPVPDLTEDGQPNVLAKHAVVVDLATGAVLYEKSADTPVPIASVSKIAAALALREEGLDLTGKQTISLDDHRATVGGARSRLRVGATFLNGDLLKAALIASDNRAVVAMGRAIGLDPSKFAAKMTAMAAKLGLEHTKFGDPTGLDEHNVSTAREVVKMLQAALADPVLRPIMSTAEAEVEPVEGAKGTIEYHNTTRPIRSGKWNVLGAKTGFTNPARYCLAIATKLSDGREVGMAFLGAEGKLTRFADFSRVVKWLEKAQEQGPPLPPELQQAEAEKEAEAIRQAEALDDAPQAPAGVVEAMQQVVPAAEAGDGQPQHATKGR